MGDPAVFDFDKQERDMQDVTLLLFSSALS